MSLFSKKISINLAVQFWSLYGFYWLCQSLSSHSVRNFVQMSISSWFLVGKIFFFCFFDKIILSSCLVLSSLLGNFFNVRMSFFSCLHTSAKESWTSALKKEGWLASRSVSNLKKFFEPKIMGKKEENRRWNSTSF